MLKRLPILAVFLVLLAFTPPVLRANTFDPSHPKVVTGICGKDVARCTDRSWWLILFGLSLLGLELLKKLKKAEIVLLRLRPAHIPTAYYFPQLFNPLQLAFRRGIIHPQIYV